MFGVNESTIRSIQSLEKLIRDAVKGIAPLSAKIIHQVRDKPIVKIEVALFIWLRTTASNEMLLRTRVKLTNKETAEEVPSTFTASKGWFDHFKRHYSLRNFKMSGEAASIDHEAASAFPQTLKELIEEKLSSRAGLQC